MSIELTDAGRAEYEALVRDAKRWRFARTMFDASDVACAVDWSNTIGFYCDPSETDAAIDAAMGAK